ncbi:MAG: hypothetical protein ACOC2D_18645 [Spirochaetota bacterium]
MRRRSELLVLVAAVAVLAACGPPETDPDAPRTADGSPLYRDGEYAAAYSHTGPDGWRPFIYLRVRAGLVDTVCFDAVDASGERLSETERFLERYRLDTGTDLLALFDKLRSRLIDRQAVPLPAAVNAVPWSVSFDVLARRALAAAKVGLTVEAAGLDVVATPGPYTASDEPDELGWRAELVLVYDGDGLAAGSYREVRRELDGSTRRKRDDAAYLERFATASGITWAAVGSTLVERLIAAQPSEPQIDAVAGATLSSARFVALAERIARGRVEAPLPNRLCR